MAQLWSRSAGIDINVSYATGEVTIKSTALNVTIFSALTTDEDVAVLIREPTSSVGRTTSISVYTGNPTSHVDFFRPFSNVSDILAFSLIINAMNDGDELTVNDDDQPTLRLTPSQYPKAGIYKIEVTTDNRTVALRTLIFNRDGKVFPLFLLNNSTKLTIHKLPVTIVTMMCCNLC